MNLAVPIALFGWPFAVVLLFALLKPRHAVITAFLGAWLFLPMAGFTFTGLPDYTKVTATAYGVLLGVILFDAGRVLSYRPSWVDIPIVVVCISPLISSVLNGLGAYDGVSVIFTQALTWGVPYFVGRLYFCDIEGLRELAIGIFIGGLIYVPLCLFEMRMSPQLHIWVYGFHQHNWRQAHRFDGWRPTVFMQHGLAVALWMVIAAMVGYWLWRTRAVLMLWKVPMSLLVPAVGVTAVLCRSAGAVVLGIAALAVLEVTRMTNLKVGMALLLLFPIGYMGLRITGAWDGSHLVRTVEAVPFVQDRAESLQYRLEAEELLAAHALRQPAFGWGGWGRNRPARVDESAEEVATDGLWIITLGQRGMVGLLAVTAVILLPGALFLKRMPLRAWRRPETAPAAVMSVMLVLFMIDSLFNAMLNPIYLLAAGGVSGFLISSAVRSRQASLATMRGRLRQRASALHTGSSGARPVTWPHA
jgi:hypothetical protein